MKYSDLPNKIRSGLDRRSISSIILLKESAPQEEDAIFLRQLVFERLNTGGIKLERQEIRNSLSSGIFNNLLFELAQNDLFRKIWGLPQFSEEEITNHKLPIYRKAFYKKMEDLEVILRFFALRHMEHFRYGIQGFLDLYMIRSSYFTDNDCAFLGDLFISSLETAYSIYGDSVFKKYDNTKVIGKPIKGMYDAIMVSLSGCPEQHLKLIKNKEIIIDKTIKLFQEKGVAALTGRASTKKDLENRIQLFKDLFLSVYQN